jgi:hypothetical protein
MSGTCAAVTAVQQGQSLWWSTQFPSRYHQRCEKRLAALACRLATLECLLDTHSV